MMIAVSTKSVVRTLVCRSQPRRSLHSRVPLPYPVEDGLGDFLSPTALKMIAVDWQQGVLDRLTDLTRGTVNEDRSVVQTVISSSQDPTQALTFNYASEALNNSFFLSTLTTDVSRTQPSPSSPLSSQIKLSSLRTYPALISHFSAHVAGLHPSSGAYVWLVTDRTGGLGVVGTYAGGSLLIRERVQVGLPRRSLVLGEIEMGSVDAASTPVESAVETTSESKEAVAEEKVAQIPSRPARKRTMFNAEPLESLSLRSFSTSARSSVDLISDLLEMKEMKSFGKFEAGRGLRPLLCLSVHPHCYINDYGVWGREEYVRRWWQHVDWRAVEDSYAEIVRKNTGK